MFAEFCTKEKSIAVIGLGYVGLPLALELARHFRVIGFDIKSERVALMKQQKDPSQELPPAAFEGCDIQFTDQSADIRSASLFIIAVPTDVDRQKNPDLNPLLRASEFVGKALKPGDCVVYESTVYPGCTEEDCVPVLEAGSGLKFGTDFSVGYSPERISPGDQAHAVRHVVKIVAASDAQTLDLLAQVYGAFIQAGIYKAPTIQVAEAAKVIENTQRDLNISLMNELAIIFDRMGIDTQEVIQAAGTKWNFLKFYPGLVGGHCIAVDPYYLLYKAKKTGYDPQVILSGRRINDGMPAFIAKKLVQTLIATGKNPAQCRVLIMGITFKENVSDIRNSKVVDLVRELGDYSVQVHIHDPLANPNELAHDHHITLVDNLSGGYDAVVLAVAHRAYQSKEKAFFLQLMKEKPILFDIKGITNLKNDPDIIYWRL
jgi:UDP-N-acetyl-D-galactosamine dehydrogenase